MINKKNLLGKVPEELGVKDAIHVAIVSVRAAHPIDIGARVTINKDNEAVRGDSKSPGIADPFRKTPIGTGDAFWMVLDLNEVPNVKHVWEHPKFTFEPPTKPARRNSILDDYAKELGVSYEQLMQALSKYVDRKIPQPYPGTLSSYELIPAMENIEQWGLWSQWASETGYEFENVGSNCCPEYEYPDTQIYQT